MVDLYNSQKTAKIFVSLLENSLGKEYNSPAWKIKITLPKGKSKI